MRLVKAKMVKRATDDGVEFFLDEVPIGFVYHADLDSRKRLKWGDRETGDWTVRDSIMIYGSALVDPNEIGYCPTELLEIEDQKVN
jgi:hypothetical protein